jgi:hypothetical protein
MTCIKRAEDINDSCGCDAAILRPCGHFECHLRQCWWIRMQRPVPCVAAVPCNSSSATSNSQLVLPARNWSLSSSPPSSGTPTSATLAQYLERDRIDTLLNMIPTSESIQRLLEIPDPVSPAIALMFTKFITLMDHFFLHYSSLPCSVHCPCHREREPRSITVDGPMVNDECESKEKKEDNAAATSRTVTSLATTDKNAKFRFNLSNRSHRGAMIRLVPHILNVFQHMGVILHGLNTCSAEQFARERYCRIEFPLEKSIGPWPIC